MPYYKAVLAAGGRPRVLSTFELLPHEQAPSDVVVHTGLDPNDASVLDGAAGLLLPGGGDIDPAWYGRPPHPATERISHRRDRFELTLLREALERDMPMLLVCHGMQLLNVLLGGTLDQHLADHPHLVDHDAEGQPRPEPDHRLRIKERSLLAEIYGTTELGVNSYHHQGLSYVPEALEEVAWAEDGVLEAVVLRRSTWVVGVQWHPEVMAPVDERQLNLFRAFVEAAALYHEQEREEARASA